jgi:hypothetical protein
MSETPLARGEGPGAIHGVTLTGTLALARASLQGTAMRTRENRGASRYIRKNAESLVGVCISTNL